MTSLLTNSREATDGQTWVDGKTEKKKRTKQLCLDLLMSAGPVSVCVRERLMNVKIKREECVRRRGEMRWFHAAWADVCHNLSDWTRGWKPRLTRSDRKLFFIFQNPEHTRVKHAHVK